MNKHEIKKEYDSKFRELRKIIHSWELISGCPIDEFDSLNQRILSHLYMNADCNKIAKVIESELIVTYGLDCEKEDSEKMAEQIIEWWNR